MAKSQKAVSTSQLVTKVNDAINAELKVKDLSVPKKIVKDIINSFLETITSGVTDGKKLRIDHVGIIQVKNRKARKGRNPQTGEEISIPASKKISFRVAKSLKEKVTGIKKGARKAPKKRK